MVASWWNCCCTQTGCVECTRCAGTGNNAPQFMYLTVSGIADSSYSSGASYYNGTFLLGVNFAPNCAWSYTENGLFHKQALSIPPVPPFTWPTYFNQATSFTYNLRLILSGSNYNLILDWGATGGGGTLTTQQFLLDLGTTAPDCTAFSSLSIPFSSGDLYVDFTGATATITSDPDAGC